MPMAMLRHANERRLGAFFGSVSGLAAAQTQLLYADAILSLNRFVRPPMLPLLRIEKLRNMQGAGQIA